MKVALASDLHLEFGDIVLKNTEKADVLILSGDILIAENLHNFPENETLEINIPNLSKNKLIAQSFREFLRRCSNEFPHVVYVAGNHEFYHGNYPDSYAYLKSECKKFVNVHFLEMDSIEINDVLFVGATLWTDMNKADPLTINACQSMMNDYRCVRNSKRSYAKLSPLDTFKRHKDTVRYFKKVLSENKNKNCIVVGHHAPTKLSIKPKYEKDHLLNGAYSSDLSELILDNQQVKLWTHGHTHDYFDYMIGTTRVVCNPRGYIGYEAQADNFELKFFEI
jgi:Icc-related predicted phosphoesterase